MKTWLLAAVALLGNAASAQDLRLTPLVDARIRWERVQQGDLPVDADAVTARVRAGLVADVGPLQALAESEATLALVERHNTGLNGLGRHPLVPDPQNIELNRAQLRYSDHEVTVTAGRQLVELADQRFVGSANWRQNQQTFDAARFQWGDPKRAFTDVTYAWSFRTPYGIEGRGARPQAIGGGNVFALGGVQLPIGTATAFAYLVDQDSAAVQAFALSSQTYGVRLAGTHTLRRGLALSYVGSLARQSDWRRNPNDYVATYWLAEVSANAAPLTLTLGHEVLGADRGRVLTSVQTPLASFFKFQGWASKFTTTPANGLRDLYASASATLKTSDPLSGVALSAAWHRFRSDRLDLPYGSEWDMLASIKRGHTVLSARYARYRAGTFAADTDKIWLEADWAL